MPKKRQEKLGKFHNKFLVLILVLSILLSGLNAGESASYAFSYEEEFHVGDDVIATLYDSGLLKLIGSGDTYDYSAQNPAPFYGKRVNITSVEIDNGITSIGDCLFFNCLNLSGTLTLPSTIVEIGDRAFSGDSTDSAPAFSYIYNEFTQLDIVEEVMPEKGDSSASPSVTPSGSPSESPSVTPSGSPSVSPSAMPSGSPSISPSTTPSGDPSASPDSTPSESLSASPDVTPTDSPAASPVATPSEPEPTEIPTPYADEPQESDSESEESNEQGNGDEGNQEDSDSEEESQEVVNQVSETVEMPDLQAPIEKKFTPDIVKLIKSDEVGEEENPINTPKSIIEENSFIALEPTIEEGPSVAPEPAIEESPTVAPEPTLYRQIVTITEQEVGYELFTPGQTGVYQCSDDNESFSNAVSEAGYYRILSSFYVSFSDGGENTGSVSVPETEPGIFLPVYAATDLEWPDETNCTYIFEGWSDGMETYLPSRFYDGEETAFSAQWQIIYEMLENQSITTTIDKMKVTISGTLPKGAEVVAKTVKIEQAQEVLDEKLGMGSMTAFCALDIEILVDGRKYQPIENEESLTVQIEDLELEESAPISVYHVNEDEESGETTLETVPVESVEESAVAFAAESFSTYILGMQSVGEIIEFDLAKGPVTLGTTYSGYSSEWTSGSADVTGTHSSENQYYITQSNPETPTANGIDLAGNNLTFDITIENLNSTCGSTGSDKIGSINIPAHPGNVKHVTIRLKGENRLNCIQYFTSPAGEHGGSQHSNSTLKITSASGDGSEDGKLIIASRNRNRAAGIGGTDANEIVTGLTLAGGDIEVVTPKTNPCTAIGGGGNGYADITIEGGKIYAENYAWSATIGGGLGESYQGGEAVINISGGTVTAINHGAEEGGSRMYGVAIGGGSCTLDNIGSKGTVRISGGEVFAQSIAGDNAIGGGNSRGGIGGDSDVTITGGTVTTIGGIGGGKSNNNYGGVAKVTISGGIVNASYIGGGNSNLRDGGAADVTISGGHLETENIGGGNTNFGIGGTASVSISGGTMVAGSIGAGFSKANGYATADVIISGGSVNAKIAATPTNGQNPDIPVFLTRASLYNSTGGIDVAQVDAVVSGITASSAGYYGTQGIKTDELGMIYLWLPDGSELTQATVGGTPYTGSIYVKAIGVLKAASCVEQYYSINIAGSEYYQLYSDEACTLEFSGAVTVRSGTLINFYVKAEKYDTTDYYAINAFYSIRSGGSPVMRPLDPVNVPQDGKYHYQISVTSDTEAFFTYTAGNNPSNLVLDIRNADAVISQGSAPGKLDVVWRGYRLSDYEGNFLLTSNGVSTGNTLTVVSGNANVFIDRLVASRAGSAVKVEGGELSLTYSTVFDNQITSTVANSPAIEVKSGGKLTVISDTIDGSLTLEGGSNSPAIGGTGEVRIVKNNDFLDIVNNHTTPQIRASKYSYITANTAGQLPYEVELASGELIGYNMGEQLFAIDFNHTSSSNTEFKACGIAYNLGTNISLTDGIPPGIDGDGSYVLSLTGASSVIVARDGVALNAGTDYTWVSANGTGTLTIPGVAAYGNLVVTAGAANDILYTATDYSGEYDGENHEISLLITSPLALEDYKIYYSTIRAIKETDIENLTASPTPTPTPANPQSAETDPEITTVNPVYQNATENLTDGVFTVYWYIEYTKGDTAYTDTSGSNTITILPGTNTWIEEVTCPSIQEGGILYKHAKAKWATETTPGIQDIEYEFSTNPSFTSILVAAPTTEGTYYIRAKAPAEAVYNNYAELVSDPLRFSIEKTKVYARAGRVLTRLGGNPSSTASISANGAFTILYSFGYTPSADTALGLAFDPALPVGSKITLLDMSRSHAPGQFYYIVGAVGGCAELSSAQIRRMGTEGGSNLDFNDFFDPPTNGVYDPITAQYQYCIEYPAGATSTEEQRITLKQGTQPLEQTEVTITRTAPTSSSGALDLGSAPAPSAGANNLSIPLSITASGEGTKVLAISLQGSDGENVILPPGTILSCADSYGEVQNPASSHRNFASFNLGNSNISGNYTVTFNGITAGSYKVKADICVVKESEADYPMHGKIDGKTTDILTVSDTPEYKLKVTQTASDHSGSGGMRVVKSGTETTLTFTLFYSTTNGTNAITVTTQEKGHDDYQDLESAWTVGGTPINGLNTGGPYTIDGVTVKVPGTVTPGTYRIVFTLGTLQIPYNIIVE